MPGPSSPATFQRPDLGQAYLEFDIMAHIQGFIGLSAMPMTPVGLQASNFTKVLLAQLLNDDRNVKRAPGAGYARQSLEFTQDNYATEERGVEELLDDRDRAIFAYTGVQFEQLAADRAVGAAWCGRTRASDCLRQRGQPHSSQGVGAGRRDGRACGVGGWSRSDHPSAPYRERHPRAGGDPPGSTHGRRWLEHPDQHGATGSAATR